MKTNNTPSTMNANEITLTAEAAAVYNAMLTPSEEPADLAWESEPKTDEELTALGLDAFGDNGTTTETTTPEFSELSHAGQCLDIYLHNTREIYERYTVPAINVCTKAQTVKDPGMWDYIKQALKAASRLVVKHDGLTPSTDDIKAVTANYVSYITGCAEYQATNA